MGKANPTLIKMKYSYPYQPPKKSLGQKVDTQVEALVYKILTNQGLEESVARAVKKALIDLVLKYILLIGVAVIAVLALQAIFIAYAFSYISNIN
ncbi:MAG: hypothetical protein AB4058_16040 [Microcystaceae cyanobacterium]